MECIPSLISVLLYLHTSFALPLQQADLLLDRRQVTAAFPDVFAGLPGSTSFRPAPTSPPSRVLPLTPGASAATPTSTSLAGVELPNQNTITNLFVPGTRFFPLGVVIICLIVITGLTVLMVIFVVWSRRRKRYIPPNVPISRPIPPKTPPAVKTPKTPPPAKTTETPLGLLEKSKRMTRMGRTSVILITSSFNYWANKRKSSALPALPYSAKALSFSSFGTTISSALPTPNVPIELQAEPMSAMQRQVSNASGLFSAGPLSVWDGRSLAYGPDSAVSRVPPTPLPMNFPAITPIEPKSSYIEQLETPVQGPGGVPRLPVIAISPVVSWPPPLPGTSIPPVPEIPPQFGRPQLSRLTIPNPIVISKRRTPVVAVAPHLDRLEEEEPEPAGRRPLPKVPPPPPPPHGPLPAPPDRR
ncbi:hypothetical protein DACRYDRAFT_110678 [Dacryopinax primogenitus]|uniref:Uncharacterized protein n=1 Tax=Dacryopinax primogenitus (strain DJM 731) TaxID=1858805 RepID=M5FTP0_DACPD|nr:uncharacterized protein DACRYDRAFT_110678 [Dacryopinax primogenitus]EJT98784.1 hypothetical protein DACRYDRAFT_110678 [Dacryopinax primogenitus]